MPSSLILCPNCEYELPHDLLENAGYIDTENYEEMAQMLRDNGYIVRKD